MARKRNYYELLHVARDADRQTILNAIEHYSQKDVDGKYQSLLATIKHTLSNPDRRRAYDRLIAQETPDNDQRNTETAAPSQFTLQEDNTDSPSLADDMKNSPEAGSTNDVLPSAGQTPPPPPNFDQHLQASRQRNNPQRKTTQNAHKDRFTATWLAFFCGGLGIHRFWLGQWYFGIIYLIVTFLTGGLSAFVAFIEALVFFFSSDESWQAKHHDKHTIYTGKDKNAAGMLAIFAGVIGTHRFYLGQWKIGFIYVLFSWTFIPWLIAIIEGIIILNKNDDDWNERYGEVVNDAGGCLPAIIALFIFSFIFVVLVGIISLAYEDYLIRVNQRATAVERSIINHSPSSSTDIGKSQLDGNKRP